VVIGGMLAATVIAVFLIPVTFYVVEKLAAKRGHESSSIVQTHKVVMDSGKGH